MTKTTHNFNDLVNMEIKLRVSRSLLRSFAAASTSGSSTSSRHSSVIPTLYQRRVIVHLPQHDRILDQIWINGSACFSSPPAPPLEALFLSIILYELRVPCGDRTHLNVDSEVCYFTGDSFVVSPFSLPLNWASSKEEAETCVDQYRWISKWIGQRAFWDGVEWRIVLFCVDT